MKIKPSSMQSIIDDARKGNFFMLFDDINEHEADFVIHPSKATPEKLNFLRKYGSGLIFLTLQGKKIKSLGIDIPNNKGKSTPPFVGSFDAQFGIKSGISVEDRAHSILTAINSNSTALDIKMPGHILLLHSDERGVNFRSGHTETSVEIMRIADMPIYSSVISEVMNPDGSVANAEDIARIAHDLKINIALISDVLKFSNNKRYIKDETYV